MLQQKLYLFKYVLSNHKSFGKECGVNVVKFVPDFVQKLISQAQM